MKKFENIPYKKTDLNECILDIYLPDAEVFPVFLYFHGGGLESGTRTDHKFYAGLLEKGIAVVTADYRMYPTAQFPDFIKDAAAAVSWVYKNINKYGNATGIFVGGSSAGGYISQMLCFDKKYLAPYGINASDIDGYIHDAGQPTTHFNVLRERGIDYRRVIIDEAAPIYHIQADSSYAPMQIIVSDADMENRLEQTYLLKSTLKHFGYDENKIDFRFIENSSHCEYVDKQNAEGKWVFAEIIYEFIKKFDTKWVTKWKSEWFILL